MHPFDYIAPFNPGYPTPCSHQRCSHQGPSPQISPAACQNRNWKGKSKKNSHTYKHDENRHQRSINKNSHPPPHKRSDEKLARELRKQTSIVKSLRKKLKGARANIYRADEIIEDQSIEIEMDTKSRKELMSENRKLNAKIKKYVVSESEALKAVALMEIEVKRLQKVHEGDKKKWENEKQELKKELEQSKKTLTKVEEQWKNCYNNDTKNALTQIGEKDAELKILNDQLNEAREYIEKLENGDVDSKDFVRFSFSSGQQGNGMNHMTEGNMDTASQNHSGSSESDQHDQGPQDSTERLEKKQPQPENMKFKTPKTEPIDEELQEPNNKKRRLNQEC